MRFVALAMFAISVPALIALFSGNPGHRRYGWFAVGLMPFVIGAWQLDAAIISWAFWPGYVKGLIVTLLDALALALLVTTKERVRRRPLMALFVLYFVASSISIVFASPKEASLFFSWQLARTLLLFAGVSKASATPQAPRLIIDGLACGIIFQACFSVNERLHGVTQATGTMGHQNLLGLATHFALLPCLGLVLSGDRRWLPKLGVAAGMICVVLTGSRATTGLAGLGVVLCILLSLIRKPTGFKWKVAMGGLAALLIAAPIAYATLNQRFEQNPLTGTDDERAAFERAANAIWADHPMGIGGNQYVVVANTRGYSERAGVIWNWTSRSAHVHNTYLLIGSETGYPGFVTFLLLFAGAAIAAARLAWARPRGPSGDVGVGLLVTLIIVGLHCLYEWVFVTYAVQYLFAIALGLIAALTKQQRGAAAAASRKRNSASQAAPSDGRPARRPVAAKA